MPRRRRPVNAVAPGRGHGPPAPRHRYAMDRRPQKALATGHHLG
ncbi:hypothetical protein [Sphingobium xenophagum]